MQRNRKRCQSYASHPQLTLVDETKILSNPLYKGNTSRNLLKINSVRPTLIAIPSSFIGH